MMFYTPFQYDSMNLDQKMSETQWKIEPMLETLRGGWINISLNFYNWLDYLLDIRSIK